METSFFFPLEINDFINDKFHYTRQNFREMAYLFINRMLLKGNKLSVPISKDVHFIIIEQNVCSHTNYFSLLITSMKGLKLMKILSSPEHHFPGNSCMESIGTFEL